MGVFCETGVHVAQGVGEPCGGLRGRLKEVESGVEPECSQPAHAVCFSLVGTLEKKDVNLPKQTGTRSGEGIYAS